MQRMEGNLVATLREHFAASPTCRWPTPPAAASPARARSTSPTCSAELEELGYERLRRPRVQPDHRGDRGQLRVAARRRPRLGGQRHGAPAAGHLGGGARGQGRHRTPCRSRRDRRDGRAQLRPPPARARARPHARRRADGVGARGRPPAHRRRRDATRGSSTSWATGCPGSRWPRGPSARRRSATGARSAATSARPRRPATACRRCYASDAEVEVASVARHAPRPGGRVHHRAEAQRAALRTS